MPSKTTHLTSGTFAAIAGLHVAWGNGSAFPFSTRDQLADAVVGTKQVPGPLACYGVASALLVAAGVIENVPPWPNRVRRAGLLTIAVVLVYAGCSAWRAAQTWPHRAAALPAFAVWTGGSTRRSASPWPPGLPPRTPEGATRQGQLPRRCV